MTGPKPANPPAIDIAATLVGIFTVAHPHEHTARARHLLDGLRCPPRSEQGQGLVGGGGFG